MMKWIISLSLVSLFCTSNVFAGCNQNSVPQAPSVPSGNTATLEQMSAAREHVQSYVVQAEDYISCIYSSIKYNYALNQIRAVADDYNNQLKIFKDRNS